MLLVPLMDTLLAPELWTLSTASDGAGGLVTVREKLVVLLDIPALVVVTVIL